MTPYYKMRQVFLQNATVILSQNATKAYYKMRHVFIAKYDHSITRCESVTILFQNATIFIRHDFYYKIRRYSHF